MHGPRVEDARGPCPTPVTGSHLDTPAAKAQITEEFKMEVKFEDPYSQAAQVPHLGPISPTQPIHLGDPQQEDSSVTAP
eukprot:6738148-Pyramimonas_sp.AAC.1